MPRAISRQKIEILTMINRFGFMTVNEVSLTYGSSLRQSYRYLEDLYLQELINRKRVFFNYSNLHWLTDKGAILCGSALPVIKSPDIYTIEHDIKVIRLFCYIKKQIESQNKDNQFTWLTPRELASNSLKEIATLRAQIHKITRDLPDALIVKDNLKIAIELENSFKSQKRWIRKINNYKSLLNQGILNKVLYYIENESIIKSLSQIINQIAGESDLKIIRWHDEQKPIR